jgi:NAD+ synthase (glutamine-hydrolysing)
MDMRIIKIAGAGLNQTPLDWAGNLANIREAIKQAQGAGASVLCLPELCITGYGCEDAFGSPGVWERAWKGLMQVLPETAGMVVTVGLPVLFNNGLFNCVAVCVDGELAGLVAKRNLAGEGLHYEPRWFKAWEGGVRRELKVGGKSVPIGDLMFDVGGVKIGLEVCEDAWVARRPGAEMAGRGVDLILNPSASHFAFGKFEVRKRFVIEGSRAFGCTYVYANYLGNEAGRAIYDAGVLVASGGRLVAQGPRFSYERVCVTAVQVDLDETRAGQARTASFKPRLAADEGCVEVGFEWPVMGPERGEMKVAEWELSGAVKEEEFTRAIALGLWDYLRKSRSEGFVVSLSGGADSACVAVLCAMMLRLAMGEIGEPRVVAELPWLACDNDGFAGEENLTGRMLTCVYQAAANSTKVTEEAAKRLAEGIGAEYVRLDVAGLVAMYTQGAQGAVGRKLTWEKDDIALQNIQARARGPGVWFIANLKNALLLATSNRSEAAVGYATMDGDTCGGLAPISGIDKAFIRRYLRWLEKTGPDGLGPIAELAAVNVQAPTAELRPVERGQTDEEDLMPYEVLEEIEDMAIGRKLFPGEVLARLRVTFEVYGEEKLRAWVVRFFELWCRNQWKRERYAPGFHVDDKNLDPRSWCRFPILSGGFREELAAMKRGHHEEEGR